MSVFRSGGLFSYLCAALSLPGVMAPHVRGRILWRGDAIPPEEAVPSPFAALVWAFLCWILPEPRDPRARGGSRPARCPRRVVKYTNDPSMHRPRTGHFTRWPRSHTDLSDLHGEPSVMGPALNPVFRGLARLARPLARPAAWLLRRQQAYLLWRLRRAIRDADAFDVVGNMFLSVAPVNSEPGDGSDGTRLLSKPELTALLFAERRSPAPRRPSPARVLGLVDKLIPRVLHSATLRALFEQVRVKHQDSAVVPRITLAAITREIYLRLPRFHQKERELLSDLFTPELHDSLVARVGFGPDAMFAIYDAFHSYIPQRLAQRAEAAKEEFTEALESSAEFASIVHSQAGGFDDAFRRVVGRRAFDELPALVALSRQDMMTATDVPATELDALLSLMSIDLDADNVGVVADFLSGNNVMRTRPFLARADANGEKAYMLVQPTSLIFGMRELFEAALTLEPQIRAISSTAASFWRNEACGRSSTRSDPTLR